MNASPALYSSRALASLRRHRRRPAMWAALCVYVLVAAIVPPGHMAAALDSGTPFHLCPGDLRSAQLLRALPSGFAGGADHDAHAQHGHAPPSGTDDGAIGTDAAADIATPGHHDRLAAALDNGAADTGCIVAAGTAMAVATAATEPDPVASASLFLPTLRSAAPRAARWLRPPVRSPPA